MNTPVIPIVHLNGSSKDDLLEQYTHAMDMVATLIKALPECHARDYYPRGEDVVTQAREQRFRWILTLNNLHDELELIACAISDQHR
jgi:hypothetical protein